MRRAQRLQKFFPKDNNCLAYFKSANKHPPLSSLSERVSRAHPGGNQGSLRQPVGSHPGNAELARGPTDADPEWHRTPEPRAQYPPGHKNPTWAGDCYLPPPSGRRRYRVSTTGYVSLSVCNSLSQSLSRQSTAQRQFNTHTTSRWKYTKEYKTPSYQ